MTSVGEQPSVMPEGRSGRAAQGIALLLPGLLFLTHLQTVYSMVSWACSRGSLTSLHIVSGATVLIAAAATLYAWRLHGHYARRQQGLTVRALGRAQFLTLCGYVLGGMFTLVLLWQFIAEFFFMPCQ